jgi:hypothetical protein
MESVRCEVATKMRESYVIHPLTYISLQNFLNLPRILHGCLFKGLCDLHFDTRFNAQATILIPVPYNAIHDGQWLCESPITKVLHYRSINQMDAKLQLRD